jgi:hypothetical protein
VFSRLLDNPNLKAISLGAWSTDQGLQGALRTAVFWVMDHIEYVPVMPIEAPERGLKSRFPTMELAAANLIHQILRRAADAHLRRDNRCSQDMGGNLPHPKIEVWPGPWYSMDLSFATDCHPHGLSIEFYEELIDCHSELECYRRFLPKLLGPKMLMDPAKCDYAEICLNRPMIPPELDCLNPARRAERRRLPSARKMSATKGFAFDPSYDAHLIGSQKLVAAWVSFLSFLPNYTHRMTTVGEMMGSASSFPIMPLVSFYAGWKSGLNRMISCGDDALVANARPHKVRRMEEALSSCGAQLSRGDPEKGKPNKIFLHPSKGLFKEQVYVDGRRKASVPISIWSAPPGGSKGQIDWLTQGSAAREMLADQNLPIRSGLWAYSPLRRQVEAAWFMGLPVAEQVALGGVLYAGFPHRALGQHDRWISLLNSLPIDKIICGTGLSPVPSPQNAVVRAAAREWVREQLRAYKSDNAERAFLVANGMLHEDAEDAIPRTLYPTCLHPSGRILQNLKDAMDTEAAALTNWTLYWAYQAEIQATPSVRKAAGKFRRKLRTHAETTLVTKVGPGAFLNTRLELLRKAELYVDSVAVARVENRDLSYGLESVPRPVHRSELHFPPGSLVDRVARNATSIR